MEEVVLSTPRRSTGRPASSSRPGVIVAQPARALLHVGLEEVERVSPKRPCGAPAATDSIWPVDEAGSGLESRSCRFTRLA